MALSIDKELLSICTFEQLESEGYFKSIVDLTNKYLTKTLNKDHCTIKEM